MHAVIVKTKAKTLSVTKWWFLRYETSEENNVFWRFRCFQVMPGCGGVCILYVVCPFEGKQLNKTDKKQNEPLLQYKE